MRPAVRVNLASLVRGFRALRQKIWERRLEWLRAHKDAALDRLLRRRARDGTREVAGDQDST